ncbi:MAG: alpha-N-arabinofuranosidase [Chlorobia bacterium]|nr:alpha-N-arabinofuranosidase [Fimbriimonadaceae bacterium]
MTATIQIQPNTLGPTVNRNVYGHFAEHLGRCIYEGIWVGESSEIPNVRGIRADVAEALRAIDIPVLRWPGGCFADEYHWKDGVGPRENRPAMINTHWGGVVENNHFGTHEFMDLCEQLDTDAYICGNVGSGSVQEMMEWVEYLTSPADSPMANWRRANGRDEPWRVPFFGVGNESWGCGGNMRPEYYADEYRRYNTFVKNYGPNKIYRIACGANNRDYRWTDVVMERVGSLMDGLSLHNYTLNGGKWPPSGSATDFQEDQWFSVLKHALSMDDLVAKHAAEMDKHDPDKQVGMVVDEWGTWFAVESGTNPGFLYQQNTMLDALVGAVHFHIFHRFADRISMANIAQTVNVLQAMILTDGPRMLRTPTYWVFEMFKVHQGAATVPVSITSPTYSFAGEGLPAISASATQRSGSNILDVSLANLDPDQAHEVTLGHGGSSTKISGRLLTASTMQAHNTFDNPDLVQPVEFNDFAVTGESMKFTLPAKSILMLSIES